MLTNNKFADVSFFGYFVAEVTHGYHLNEDKQMYSEKQRRITTFMKTPRELEKVRVELIFRVMYIIVSVCRCLFSW